MHSTKVVNLGHVKDLLALWDQVRSRILAGRVVGFHTALQAADGGESLFVGGTYENDPEASVRTVLKVSAFRMLEDEPA